MEIQPTQEQNKKPETDKEHLSIQLGVNAMLAEYLAKGGNNKDYIEYLKGNRLDPRD